MWAPFYCGRFAGGETKRALAGPPGRGSAVMSVAEQPHFVEFQGDTFVSTLLLLCVETGSFGDVELTVAMFVKIPFFMGFSVRVIVAVSAFAIVPMSQV
jgi:hypothetical protein